MTSHSSILVWEAHEQRSLGGYSPWGYKESDTTEHAHTTNLFSRAMGLKSEVKIAQLCPALCDPMDFTVHGIFQARILGWVAFHFSRVSSEPRD